MSVVETRPRSAWSGRGWGIYLGWTVITLDGSALNLALPTIAVQWDVAGGALAWVVDAYTLPLAALLLLGGNLGDRWGPQRLFRIGAIGFAAASVLCGASPSLGALIAARAAQGVFAAMLLPMVLALIGRSFNDPRQRGTAVNMLAAFGGAGAALGPFLGGLFTDTVGWRSVFWLTAPVAITAALLVGRGDERPERASLPRIDVPGVIVGTAGLVTLVTGLIEVGRDPRAATTWITLAAGVALLLAFLAVERLSAAPMMPLGVFRAPLFAGAVVGGFAFQFGAYGLQFFLAVYLQTAWGVTALTGGLLLVSFAVGSVLGSLLINPFLLPHGPRLMILLGSITAGVGAVALLAASSSAQWWLLVAADFVIGMGTAVYSTALNTIAGSSLGADTAGLASGIYNTSRQVGQSVGIAFLGALAVAAHATLGYTVAILLVVLCAVVIGVTGLSVPARRRESATRGGLSRAARRSRQAPMLRGRLRSRGAGSHCPRAAEPRRHGGS